MGIDFDTLIIYYLYFLVFIFGVTVGSFLNVVIYRVPAGISIVYPGSSCPACGEPLKWQQLIPVISYLWQRGKCSSCQTAISPQYITIELLTGLIYIAIFYSYSISLTTVAYWLLAPALLALSIIDWRHLIIPDKINGYIFILGLLASIAGATIPLTEALLGSIVGGGVLLLLAVLSRGGMGGGDIKLIFGLGLFTGWQLNLLLLFIAATAGSIYGIGKIAISKERKGKHIPFGPFLAVAGIIVLQWGWDILNYYLTTFY
ncbi:MAG: prepilin peptidase [Bacillota bacterium]|nr:prepilin peptidase [Bacillota bacterium]